MKDIMIDLETMGTKSRSLIASIGAVFFDIETGETANEFHQFLNWEDCLRKGMKIDVSTLTWWLEQNDEARKKLIIGSRTGQLVDVILYSFSDFVNMYDATERNTRVWGNGATFDISLLEDAYELMGITIRKTITRDGVHHDALDDAKYQAKYISAMYRAIIKG